jgi:diacylglycerol kinase
MLGSQQNARIHCLATFLVIAAGLRFELGAAEWRWIAAATAAVWAAEAFNTALETLTDLASPDFHPLAADAKDLSAGAVLLTAAGAGAVGLLVFGPHFWKQFE